MSDHVCKKAPYSPKPGWISVYWDCEEERWILTSLEIQPTEEAAILEAAQWGSPSNISTYMLADGGWNNWSAELGKRALNEH